MKLNSNGSGEIDINYILDQGLKGISSLGSDDDIVPLNLSEDYIREISANRDDIRYKNYVITEDESFYNVSVTFEFDSIEALNSVLPKENAISIKKEGNETVLFQNLISDSSEELNSETLGIFKDIFADHSVTFKIKTPSEIIKVENGSKIGTNIAIYQESFIDVISTTEKKSWSIRW
ncbi:MAG: hypothetical protein OCD02_21035 [Spirochaetaceae bacterium]